MEAAEAFSDFITGETLAAECQTGDADSGGSYGFSRAVDLDGLSARIALTRMEVQE